MDFLLSLLLGLGNNNRMFLAEPAGMLSPIDRPLHAIPIMAIKSPAKF